MARPTKQQQDKAIVKTVSITPTDLNDIIKVYGSLTKGVKILASQARLTIQANNSI